MVCLGFDPRTKGWQAQTNPLSQAASLKFGFVPVVLGGESNSRGRGFESKHREIDGHFILINLLPKLLENRRKRGLILAKKYFVAAAMVQWLWEEIHNRLVRVRFPSPATNWINFTSIQRVYGLCFTQIQDTCTLGFEPRLLSKGKLSISLLDSIVTLIWLSLEKSKIIL